MEIGIPMSDPARLSENCIVEIEAQAIAGASPHVFAARRVEEGITSMRQEYVTLGGLALQRPRPLCIARQKASHRQFDDLVSAP